MREMIAIAVGILLGLAPEGWAANVPFSCGDNKKISTILPVLKPGDVLLVSGTCNENVVIDASVNDITLDGQNVATIQAVDAPGGSAVEVRGRGIAIQNFTISGFPGSVASGIFVHNGGQARITGNTITGHGLGIQVSRGSSAQIVNNTIQGNALGGIFVVHNSAAEIGVHGGADTIASPNVITGNGSGGGDGITITRSSSARIVGNTISGNGAGFGAGVSVVRGSQADISTNTINQNVTHGVNVAHNSMVFLGRPSGGTIFDLPNQTTSDNGGVGLRCTVGGAVLGRLGTLRGAGGQASDDGTCIVTLADFP